MHTDEHSVLILGANGRFGRAAAEAFAAAGWRVLAQARRPPDAAWPGRVQPLLLPLSELAPRCAGVRVVVHALNPPYTRWATEALPLARQAMELAQRLDARFMLPGNVYNFGRAMPARLEPGTPQRADTAKGRIRVQIEDEMRARRAQGLRSVVIRAGDFYGAGRGAWLDQVVLASLDKGRLVYPGPLHVPHAWAYVPDLAKVFVTVAESARLPAFAELHFAGHTLSGEQLLDAVQGAAAALGVVPVHGWRRRRLPWTLLRLGAPFVPTWRELVEMEYLWRVPHALDDAALRALIGPPPCTPLGDAMRATLRALGQGG